MKNDLGAVGPVGAPSAVGLSFDAEAVVDLGVVPFAEQRGVVQAGLAAVEPVDEVVDVAPVGRCVAAGEHAVPVAASRPPGVGAGGRPGGCGRGPAAARRGR